MFVPMVRCNVPPGCTFYLGDDDSPHGECVAVHPGSAYLDLPDSQQWLPHVQKYTGHMNTVDRHATVYINAM